MAKLLPSSAETPSPVLDALSAAPPRTMVTALGNIPFKFLYIPWAELSDCLDALLYPMTIPETSLSPPRCLTFGMSTSSRLIVAPFKKSFFFWGAS